MLKLSLLASASLAVLATACSPADGVPVAVVHAVSLTAQVSLHPEPAAGALDGQVHEYH
jgi:hypothetical protein